jgi:HPt (histidine-containing phosphotransfer) domain-containing protein
MVDHISKPIHIQEMFATIARWVKPAHPGGQGDTAAQPPAPPREAAPALPDALPGIDIAAGLARTLGDPVFYRSLLRMFHESQHRFAFDFDRACDASDPGAPERLAHTLRGAAATVGAAALATAAGALEQACADPSRDRLAARDRVLAELAPVMAGLATLAPLPAAPVDDATAEPSPAPALIEQLRALLAEGDPAAADLMHQHAQTLSAHLLQHWPALTEAVAAFDFEAALAVLQPADLSS